MKWPRAHLRKPRANDGLSGVDRNRVIQSDPLRHINGVAAAAAPLAMADESFVVCYPARNQNTGGLQRFRRVLYERTRIRKTGNISIWSGKKNEALEQGISGSTRWMSSPRIPRKSQISRQILRSSMYSSLPPYTRRLTLLTITQHCGNQIGLEFRGATPCNGYLTIANRKEIEEVKAALTNELDRRKVHEADEYVRPGPPKSFLY